MIRISLIPIVRKPRRKRPVEERFWSKVDKNGPMCERLGSCCWVWPACTVQGYGQFRLDGKTQLAHRLAWSFENGPLPDVERYHDAEVMHECDNPSCCNPKHLRIGTHRENLQDMTARGRHFTRTKPERVARGDRHMSRTKPETVARGDRNGSRQHPERLSRGDSHYSRQQPELLARGVANGNAKLNEDKVRAIRSSSASDESLASDFSIHPDTIRQIRTYKTWKHVQI